MTSLTVTDIPARLAQAMTFQRSGLLDRAEELYQQVLAVDPRHFDAMHLLGVIAHQRGEPSRAEAAIRAALAINPQYAAAHTNLATVLSAQGKYADALSACGNALALKPNDVEALYARGTAEQGLGHTDLAEKTFSQVLQQMPGHSLARVSRGVLLQRRGSFHEALADFDSALVHAPALPLAHYNRANVLKALGRATDAEQSVRQAVKLAPEFAEAHVLLAECLFLRGEMQSAWAEYEWRRRTHAFQTTYPARSMPRWDGYADVQGKTVLVWAEQGLGDTVQFCRYVTALQVLGAHVVLDVPPPLRELVKPLAPALNGSQHIDFHVPLLSLPLRFGVIAGQGPYLNADRELQQNWQRRLGERRQKRIGIAWSGSTTHQNDKQRSIPLARFIRMFGDNVELVSLQKDVRDSDRASLQNLTAVRDISAHLSDLSQTAAAIAAVDLVVSVDTVVAHLAGALGKPVWILLPFAPDWRWGLERADTSWYASAKLYRQPALDDWDSALARVTTDIAEWARR